MNSKRILLLLFLLVVFVIVARITRSPERPWSREGVSLVSGSPVDYTTFEDTVMATTIRVTLPEGPEASAAAATVFDIFRQVDARMSEWKDSSPLAAVNRAAGIAPVAVPEDLRRVIQRGIEIGDSTGGAFDLTWAALWGLWDFKSREPRVPADEAIASRVGMVDYRRVIVDDAAGTVFLEKTGMKIGLGGIAKGYALDRAATALRARGLTSFMILGGGQVWAEGSRRGKPWRVGIRDPRGPSDDFFAALPVEDVSLSTSGDYESYFIVGGRRYHHILDPATGRPARGLRSATVVSADATLADALSTAFMVLGVEKSLAVARNFGGVEAVLVDRNGGVHLTPGLEGRLLVRHPPRDPEGER